jgi:DGQHR domain-containing protein
MKLQAMKVCQNGKDFFITKFTAEQLSDDKRIIVDTWEHKGGEGYQRLPDAGRAMKFAKFLRLKLYPSPLPVLLSVRSKIKFSEGVLEISDSEKIYQVDGQHRIQGIRFLLAQTPEFKDLEIPAIIIVPAMWGDGLDSSFHEGLQFQIINKTQKSVKTDLTERFLAKIAKQKDYEQQLNQLPAEVIKGIEYVPDAIALTEELNKSEGVWKNKVRFPNQQKKGPSLVNQKSFTDSLKPVVTCKELEEFSIKEKAEILLRYWTAIKELCPEAFENPDKYIIQKVTGVFVLNSFFITVLGYLRNEKLTVAKFKEILSKLKLMKSNEWEKKAGFGLFGTNHKAFSIIERKLRAELMDATPSSKKQRQFEI